MVYYTAILIVLLVPLVSVISVSTESVAENDTFTKVQERNRTVLFRLAQEIRQALAATVVITPQEKKLRFSLPDEFDGTGITPGPTITYAFQLEGTEQPNGRDDNGNGLIDEGRIVRQDESSGQSVSIASGIDLAASDFAWAGTGVAVTVTTSGVAYSDSQPFKVSRTVTIHARN
jgi:hypothetical protein